jgi:transposase-like protein
MPALEQTTKKYESGKAEWEKYGWDSEPKNGREYKMMLNGEPQPQPWLRMARKCRQCGSKERVIRTRSTHKGGPKQLMSTCLPCERKRNRDYYHKNAEYRAKKLEYDKMYKALRRFEARGTFDPIVSKLTDTHVKDILEKCLARICLSEIARQYKVNRSTISMIKNGNTHKKRKFRELRKAIRQSEAANPLTKGEKLTDAQVLEIWKLCSSGQYSYAEVAVEYGVSRSLVSFIMLREAHKELLDTHFPLETHNAPQEEGNRPERVGCLLPDGHPRMEECATAGA